MLEVLLRALFELFRVDTLGGTVVVVVIFRGCQQVDVVDDGAQLADA